MSGNDQTSNIFLPNNKYRFESAGRLSTEPDSQEVKKFLKKKLSTPENAIDYKALDDTARAAIAGFMTHHHLAIMRYQTLLDREKRHRAFFIGFSFVLLALVPLSIFLLSEHLAGKSSNIIAQITAMLTGLLAVQKALSSWLDKRVIIGNFYRAQSTLKSNLYTFEDQWRGKLSGNKEESSGGGKSTKVINPAFLKAISDAIKVAREVVVDEQTKFYEALTYPSIDVGSILKGAAEASGALTGRFRGAELALRETQEKIAGERQSLRNLLGQTLTTLKGQKESLDELVEKQEAAFEGIPADTKDDGAKKERARLEKVIADLKEECLKLARQTVETEAKLKALDAPERVVQ